LNANFRISVQLAEKRAVSVLVFPQQNHRVVGTLNPTPVRERNHGQMAVKRLDHALIGKTIRRIEGQVRPGELGKRSAQAIVIRSENTMAPHAVGDFQSCGKGPANDAID
jgi:hypothetical protein